MMKKLLLQIIIVLLLGLTPVFAQAQKEESGYNKFNSKNFLLYLGVGYGTEAVLNYKQFNLYTAKTKNNFPPIGIGFEYALINFFSMGAEINFFQFSPANSLESGKIDLFLMKFRNLLYYSFNPVTFYLGGSLGVYMTYNNSASLSTDQKRNGGLSFSGLAGLRIFFADTFFIYSEAAYPFPLFIGGVGFKI